MTVRWYSLEDVFCASTGHQQRRIVQIHGVERVVLRRRQSELEIYDGVQDRLYPPFQDISVAVRPGTRLYL